MMAADSGIKRRFRRNRSHCVVFFPLEAWHWGIVLILFTLFVPWVNATNPCTDAQFWVVNADNTSSCVDCESCHPGQGLSHECGKLISSNAMVTCVPCQEGITFSIKKGTSMCRPCSGSCSEDQVVLQHCTPTTDVECAKQCYSKDKYYDEFNSCSPCSRCCGDDQDVLKDECKRKLQGVAANMVCSFHSSVNRCDITTTASPTKTTTIISTSILARTSSSVPHRHPGTVTSVFSSPTDATTSISVTHENTDTVTSGGQSSPKDFNLLAVAVIVPVVTVLGLATAIVCVLISRGRLGSCWFGHDVERGVRYSAKDAQVSVAENEGGLACKLLSTCTCKSSKVKLEATRTESCEPLLTIKDSTTLTCSCQTDSKKESKLLSSLLNDESTLKRICEVLDTYIPGRGHYKIVAEYYGFDHYQISSVLETFLGGPTRALIESLTATYPDLTVQEFASVVREKTQRNDVPKLLRAYDLAEGNK